MDDAVVDVMGPLVGVEYQWIYSVLSWESEVTWMAPEILGMAEAARRAGITTREMVQLVYDRRIRFVILDGIPSIPEDALEEYRRTAS